MAYFISQVLESSAEIVIWACSTPDPHQDHTTPNIDHRRFAWAADPPAMTVDQMCREALLLVPGRIAPPPSRELTQFRGRRLQDFRDV